MPHPPLRTVVVTGGRAPVALCLARHLAAAGCRVVVAESMAWPTTRASLAVALSVRVPPPRQKPAAFLDALERIVRDERASLVVPTCEETFTVARLLARGVPVLTSPRDVLARLHDKGAFAATATAAGVRVPETHRLTSRAALAPFLTDAWVLKPAFSRFGADALVPPHRRRALAALQPTPERPLVAQRFVPGRQVCTYAVAHAGRIVAQAAYATPYAAGRAGVWFRHEPYAEALAMTQRVAAHTGFTGQIALDVIEDADGRAWAIECNPRATSGLHLFRGDPAFARAVLDPDAVRVPVEPVGRDAMLALPMLAAGAAHGFDRPWRSAFASARDVAWDAGDPLPAAGQLLTQIEAAHQAIRLLPDESQQQAWYEALRVIARQPASSGLLAGAATRLLFDGQQLAPAATATLLGLALAPAQPTEYATAWIEGFLRGSGLLLIHNQLLFGLLDEWLTNLEETVFQEVVPLLRRSFADFSQPERQQVLALAAGAPATGTHVPVDIDLDRGLRVLPVLRELLGFGAVSA